MHFNFDELKIKIDCLLSFFVFFFKQMSNNHQDFSPDKLYPNCTSPFCPYQMHKLTCDEMTPCDCLHMTEEILELQTIEFERQAHFEQVTKPKLKDIPVKPNAVQRV